MSSAKSFDLVILGGGPGGYVAALSAATKGLKTAVIEERDLGGTCLNRGCIPTKALVGVAERFQAVREASKMGIVVGEASLNPEAVWQFQEGVTSRLRKGLESLFAKKGIELISGRGKLASAEVISVTGQDGEVLEYQGKHLLLATGSIPRVFPGWETDGRRVVTSDDALALGKVPESLLIIGGGYIGCEFASIFASLGSKVTILEGMPEILPMVDAEVTKRLKSYLKRQGISFKTGVKVERVWPDGEHGRVKTVDEEYEADTVLISVGRVANSADLGLELAGVELNGRGEVRVDERMRTNLANVYAIGDLVDRPYKLAHVASKQGQVAVANIVGEDMLMDYSAVPSAIFTSPEVAMVGLTEAEAKEQGFEPVVGTYMFTANGKALSIDDNRGLVKVVATSDGRPLGVHILGPHASDLLPEAVLAVKQQIPVKDWAQVIRAHPTLAETVAEAVESVFGHPVHA